MNEKNRIGRKILYVISGICNYKVIGMFSAAKNRILTEAIRRRLKKCGKDFWIEGPTELKGLEYISIGDDFSCRSGLRMDAIDNYNGQKFSPHIEIGNHVRINNYCHIGIIKELIIEDNVVIASKVYISDHSHGEINGETMKCSVKMRPLYAKGKVQICRNVWVGENVSILSGVVIGENSIVGANSVVTKSIPPNSVAVGAPARILKTLD